MASITAFSWQQPARREPPAACYMPKAEQDRKRECNMYRKAAHKVERSALAPKPAAAPNAVQIGVKCRVAVVPLRRHIKVHHQRHLPS